MNRKEKIKLLQQISEGRATPDVFREGRIYFVVHDSKHETYTLSPFGENGPKRVLNKMEFEQFRQRIERQNESAPPFQKSVFFWYDLRLWYPDGE